MNKILTVGNIYRTRHGKLMKITSFDANFPEYPFIGIELKKGCTTLTYNKFGERFVNRIDDYDLVESVSSDQLT